MNYIKATATEKIERGDMVFVSSISVAHTGDRWIYARRPGIANDTSFWFRKYAYLSDCMRLMTKESK